MSRMLNALKRIEAKQSPGRAHAQTSKTGWQPVAMPAEPDVRTDSQAAARKTEPIELPPALPAESLSNLFAEDFTAQEPVSLDAAMDHLQDFISAVGSIENADLELDQAEHHEPQLPIVEPVNADPYAATAAAILRQLPPDRSLVLLFTSPADGHGKTMTLARLAPRLAQGMEGQVLVVDANFRNPDMARWLAVAPTWRLPDVLAGTTDWAAAVHTTAYERVSLLPGGTDALGRGPGRTVQGVSQLLRDLTGHYRLVVVDSSSLAHRGTVQLAAVCDATYLVVRLGDGNPRLVREAAQVLQRNGGRLAGCVAVDAGQ